ncbi:hypothetical protein ACQKMN_16945 [Ureibacillus composti]
MERKSPQSFIMKKDDLIRLGVTVERLCNSLKNAEYGNYGFDKNDQFQLPAILIIDGMQEWQEENNIGIRVIVRGEGYDEFEVYNLREEQEKMDKAISQIDW